MTGEPWILDDTPIKSCEKGYEWSISILTQRARWLFNKYKELDALIYGVGDSRQYTPVSEGILGLLNKLLQRVMRLEERIVDETPPTAREQQRTARIRANIEANAMSIQAKEERLKDLEKAIWSIGVAMFGDQEVKERYEKNKERGIVEAPAPEPGLVETMTTLASELALLQDRLGRLWDRVDQHGDVLDPLVAIPPPQKSDIDAAQKQTHAAVRRMIDAAMERAAEERTSALAELETELIAGFAETEKWALRYRDEVTRRESRPSRLASAVYAITGRWSS